MLGGDSGEFQFAAWLGGFAHPTGYPLYLLLGYLWTHLLPIADAAWRMNAFSALWGAVAVGLLYLLALRMLQITAPAGWPVAISRLLALLAAAIFAVTPTFWSQAVVAEVYTLNAALIVAILLALVTWAARGSIERALSRRIPVRVEPGPPPDDTPVDPGHRGVSCGWLNRQQDASTTPHPVTPSPCHPVASRPRAAAPLPDHPADRADDALRARAGRPEPDVRPLQADADGLPQLRHGPRVRVGVPRAGGCARPGGSESAAAGG